MPESETPNPKLRVRSNSINPTDNHLRRVALYTTLYRYIGIRRNCGRKTHVPIIRLLSYRPSNRKPFDTLLKNRQALNPQPPNPEPATLHSERSRFQTLIVNVKIFNDMYIYILWLWVEPWWFFEWWPLVVLLVFFVMDGGAHFEDLGFQGLRALDLQQQELSVEAFSLRPLGLGLWV